MVIRMYERRYDSEFRSSQTNQAARPKEATHINGERCDSQEQRSMTEEARGGCNWGMGGYGSKEWREFEPHTFRDVVP